MLKFQMVGFVNKLFLSEKKSPILSLNSVYPICFPEVLLLSWNSEVAFDRGYSLVEILVDRGVFPKNGTSFANYEKHVRPRIV